MKVIILAAGQGTRLKPLTDQCPKCMVEVNGKTIIDRQLDVMEDCGIKDEDIYIITGYREEVLREHFMKRNINFIINQNYETTNMVCSLMCAKEILEQENDIIVSYGDIIYEPSILRKALYSQEKISVIVDDGWYEYWSQRCANPLEDAETLLFDSNDYLIEIGQKTTELANVQSQYIGLMHFQKGGVEQLLELAKEAESKTKEGKSLWRTTRDYSKMYMTDLLQGLIDEGKKLKAVHINRGWYEIDNYDDLNVVEKSII